jgi:hypothetical protein
VFGTQLLGQRDIALGFGNHLQEWHEQNAALDRFVDASERWLVVASDPQGELRQVGEEVLPHEPGCNLIAARELLELRLVPGAVRAKLLAGDHAGAAQHRHVARVPVGTGREQQILRPNGGIFAEDVRDGV